jgi:hypothetical protein
MTLILLCSISALLFIGVTSFCERQGLFDGSAMGIGWVFAFGLYVLVWFGGSALACVVAYLVHRVVG